MLPEHEPCPKTRPFDFSAIYASMSRHAIIEHDPGPSYMRVNTIMIETKNDLDFDRVMSKRELELYTAYIRMMYKREYKKIHPANIPLTDGVDPGGGVNSNGNLGAGSSSSAAGKFPEAHD